MLCELKSVQHTFDDTPVFQPVSVVIRPEQWISLTGTNGSGKSTLLRIISGALKPSAGSVTWACASQDIGVLLMKSGFHPQWTVRETLRFWKCALSAEEKALNEVMERFELTKFSEQRAGKLSAGWQRRLALARVFMKPRRLYVFDEIENFLDEDFKRSLLGFLEEKRREGATVVASSHDVQKSPATWKWRLENGKVTWDAHTR